jgi:hypothetical protein
VDAEVLESVPVEEPLPETLLPALVDRVRRARRRRLAVTGGLAAAAVAAVLALGLGATGVLGGDDTPTAREPVGTASPAAPAGRTMLPVGHTSVRGSLALEQVAWGTRLDLTCSYGSGRYHSTPGATYVLFVTTRDGRTQQVGTWHALDGRTMRLTAATAASRDEIDSVEVRTPDGKAVLTLDA